VGKKASDKVTHHGGIPDDIDERLVQRDQSPLPDDALLRFQSIAHGPDPRSNHRWVLYDDGRLFLAFHSRDTEGEVPFDTELPDKPTRVLSKKKVAEIRQLLEDEDFAELSPYQAREGEDGMSLVVTARLDGQDHEVIYDRVHTPLTDRLLRVQTDR
jgi:hypothetical protein